MRSALFIAKRYLFARKSHNVINIISAISAIGMAIGTAALIIILSVYNGFDSLVRSMMSNVEPDLMITPSEGKVFIPEGEVYDWIYEQPEVLNMCCVLQDQVFISYDGKQGLATAKGVDWIYEDESPIQDHMVRGSFSLHDGQVLQAVTGAGLAYEMGINPRFLSPIEIHYPSRTRRISLSSPMSSIRSAEVFPAGIFSVNDDIDRETMIIPIEVMRDLLEHEDEVSAVEIRVTEGTDEKGIERLRKEIEDRLDPGLTVKDRYRQNETLYKMMRYEKAATYMILFFVIIVIAFNIFGSLTMLIIEKKEDIMILKCMGAKGHLIDRIFILEGWMISLAGLAAGTAAGLILSLLQQYLGIIKMPGHFIVQAYPVIISWSDILLTITGVAAIGYAIATLPVLLRRREWNQ